MLNVWICDDEEEPRTAFEKRHNGMEGVRITKDIVDSHSLPQYLRGDGPQPDLVVLDLYRTNAEPGSPEAQKVNKAVKDQVACVERELNKLKEIVDKDETPAAISVLREIREDKRLCHLPVMLYTRQGLSILDPERLNDAIDLHADWMLKGRGAAIERRYMFACLARHKHTRHLERDVLLTVIGAVCGAILGWLLCLLF